MSTLDELPTPLGVQSSITHAVILQRQAFEDDSWRNMQKQGKKDWIEGRRNDAVHQRLRERDDRLEAIHQVELARVKAQQPSLPDNVYA